MSAQQGIYACRITVDRQTADVVREESKLVLVFNHETFEDFSEFTPVDQEALADIFCDAIAVIKAVGWEPAPDGAEQVEIPLTVGHIEQLRKRRKDLDACIRDLLYDLEGGRDRRAGRRDRRRDHHHPPRHRNAGSVVHRLHAHDHGIDATRLSGRPPRRPHRRPALPRSGQPPGATHQHPGNGLLDPFAHHTHASRHPLAPLAPQPRNPARVGSTTRARHSDEVNGGCGWSSTRRARKPIGCGASGSPTRSTAEREAERVRPDRLAPRGDAPTGGVRGAAPLGCLVSGGGDGRSREVRQDRAKRAQG